MKVFRGSICYVDFTDITRFAVPSYFVMNQKIYEDGEMVVIDDPKSIEYIRNREYILDFDEISKLDEQELDLRIKEAHDLLEMYAKRLLDLPIFLRNNLYKEDKFMNEYKIKQYIYYSLLDYKLNKKKIDNTILTFIFNEECQLMLKKNQKVLSKTR